MPAFPYRRDRVRATQPLEQWRAPRPGPDDARAMLRGAAIGLAAGTVMWVAVIVASTLVYRWWVG
jgi:hypothetical protein